MSKKVESLVWDRTRAGKTDLLMLIKIADLCPLDDGLGCFAEVPYLAKCCRLSERAAQYTLLRLERRGEIEIEYNDGGREVPIRGGRLVRPKWFIHVRCVCDWDAYQRGEKPATPAGSDAHLRTGRPRRKPATPAGSVDGQNPQLRPKNPQEVADKPAKTRSAYKEGSVLDPCIEQEQGSAPLSASPEPPRTPEDNLAVVTRLAHEVLDMHELTADVSERDIVDSIELRCSPAVYDIAVNRDVVYRAIAAAVYQRRRAGKTPVLANSPGDSAFRMKEAH